VDDDVVVRPDQVSLGVLVNAVPRSAVEDALVACGVIEKRKGGKLPPHVVAYLVMALCLFADDDYEEVATKVTGSLSEWGAWNASWTVATAGGISQARKRLGRDVFREIFERTCGPVAGDTGLMAGMLASGRARGSFLRGWRLLAIDGFDVDVPDTKENAGEFGYAGSGERRSAFVKARVVALSECGTHAFVAAEVDAYGVGEKTLANRLYPRLQEDEILIADRNFYSFAAWGVAASTGAQLLWRAPTQLGLPVIEVPSDGSYLSLPIDPRISAKRRERLVQAAREGDDVNEGLGEDVAHLVRVIEYTVADRVGNGHGELIVLLSTITDRDDARAEELAAAYHQRWEHETANDQLKTHLRGPAKVLRSRLPDLVHQEIWAWLILHHAISALIAAASEAADIDPDRVSFSEVLNLVRRTATGTAAFPP
jgi:transposase IS4-like protein/DDE family transposase